MKSRKILEKTISEKICDTKGKKTQNGDGMRNGETLSIYVAMHKKEQLDLPDGYKICQVNAEKNGQWTGQFAHDNDGSDNISLKNDRYSELTALYELWKNNDSDIKGLAHYRRFFTNTSNFSYYYFGGKTTKKKQLRSHILEKDTIIREMKTNDIIVEFPFLPYCANVYEDLLRFVYPHDIRALGNVIHYYFPDYEKSYNTILHSTHISYLNIFIARKEVFSAYCKWLFDVLLKLENEIRIEDYDVQHKRIFGYLGEVLLNVWIYQNKLRIKHAYIINVSTEKKDVRKKNPGIIEQSNKIRFPLCNHYINKIKKTVHMYFLQKGEALKILRQDPYAFTLDNEYQKINSLEDAERYFISLNDVTVCRETVIINNREYAYVCLKKECNIYQYLQSNNRCIITVFINIVEDVEAFVKSMVQKYGEQYTINVRIISSDPHVQQYGDQTPEIYVFFRESYSCS